MTLLVEATDSEWSEYISNISRDSIYAEAPDPAFFANAPGALGKGLAQSVAQAAMFAGDAADPILRGYTDQADAYFGTNFDTTLDAMRKNRYEVVKSLEPDPMTTGALGQVLYGVSSVLPQAAAGFTVGGPAGAAATLYAVQGYNEVRKNLENGVDATTALTMGNIVGTTNAIGVAMPAAIGVSTVAKVASGAGMNTALGALQRGASQQVLRAGGYDEMADQYKIWDGAAITTDLILGAGFGGLHPSQVRHSDVDAAMAHNNARQHLESAPGLFAVPDDLAAHAKAMETATRQVIDGVDVNVESALRETVFVPKELDQQDAADVLKAREDSGLADLEDRVRAVPEMEAAPIIRKVLKYGRQITNKESFTGFDANYTGKDRYDGNGGTFGPSGVYLDADGKWTGNTMNGLTYNKFYDVETAFEKPFLLTPETAKTLGGTVDNPLTGEQIVSKLKKDGYDAIVVEGFDALEQKLISEVDNYGQEDARGEKRIKGKFPVAEKNRDTYLQGLIDEGKVWNKDQLGSGLARFEITGAAANELGLYGDVAQDQVFAFYPEKLKVIGESGPLKERVSFTPKQPESTTAKPTPDAPSILINSSADTVIGQILADSPDMDIAIQNDDGTTSTRKLSDLLAEADKEIADAETQKPLLDAAISCFLRG